MHRLLVMSCGKRKRSDAKLLSALERYNGPSFRVLRHYLTTQPAWSPDIYILSAKFGLIPADQPIAYYDQRMTPQRAAELHSGVQAEFARVLVRPDRKYEQIYVGVGRDYALVLDARKGPIPTSALLTVSERLARQATGAAPRLVVRDRAPRYTKAVAVAQ